MQFFKKKYRQIHPLGIGGFGIVHLVQDAQKNKFALKRIPKLYRAGSLDLRSYVDGEVECLKLLKSPHIINLYDYEQDKDFFYLLLQYCDQGDLYSYMLNHNLKKFYLSQATQLLADIIKGLEFMHNAGFLHRDLKPQNILIKTQNNRKVAKLGDFGVSKRVELNTGSYLGTKHFQSPQVLQGQKYGYQIDMWAFGVVFYYMLNGKLLFKQSFNRLLTPQQQKQSLLKQAQGFSYKKMVQNSMFNDDIQDLFKRIFEIDPKKRITFRELRQHPIFSKHFREPQLSNTNREQNLAPRIQVPSQANQVSVNEGIRKTQFGYKIFEDLQFSTQNQISLVKKDEINFLNFCVDVFYEAKQFLPNQHRLMLCYNVKKYALIILRDYRLSLKKQSLAKRYSTQELKKLASKSEFKLHKKSVNSQWNRTQVEMVSLHDQCLLIKNQINAINKKFNNPFEFYVKQTKLDGEFKQSYRQSASIIYSFIHSEIKKFRSQAILQPQKVKKLLLLLTLLVICHSFNHFEYRLENTLEENLKDKEIVQNLFVQYFQQTGKSVGQFLFMGFAYWLKKAQIQTLNKIIWAIVKMFFRR